MKRCGILILTILMLLSAGFGCAEELPQITIRSSSLPSDALPLPDTFRVQWEKVDHLCADDLSVALLVGDPHVDIYQVPVSEALRRMMEKGYLAPLNDNETVMAEYQRFYPAIADALAWEEKVYAVPVMAQIDAWTVRADVVDRVTVPNTLADLLEMQRHWDNDPANIGIPLMSYAFQGTNWSAQDYACYILDQYILTRLRDDGTLTTFDSPDFREPLQQVKALVGGALPVTISHVNAQLGKNQVSAFLAGGGGEGHFATNYCLHGLWWKEAQPVLPPTLVEGLEPCVPVLMDVYVVNPYSKNLDAVNEYLSFYTKARPTGHTDLLLADAKPNAINAETIQEIEDQIHARQKLLDEAEPEDRKFWQDSLDAAKALLASYQSMPEWWEIYAPALDAYQQLIVPRMAVIANRCLEFPKQGHSEVRGNLVSLITRYLEGSMTLDQCIRKMDTMIRAMAMEDE